MDRKKKKILLIVSMLVVSCHCYSQVLDYAQLECLYRYEMIGDRLQLNRKVKDETMLLVGDKYSYYYSYMNHLSDSLRKANPEKYELQIKVNNTPVVMSDKPDFLDIASKGGTVTVSAPLVTLPYNIFNWEYYLVNRATGELECTDAELLGKSRYYYKEIPEKPVWKISSETCTVAGYRCQKATARYGGRDWTAWFSPEIALGEGPWKLRGLPGLILKAETADGEFALTCTSLKRSTGRPIVAHEQQQYRSVSKEELFKMKTVGAKSLSRPINYNFIEILEK